MKTRRGIKYFRGENGDGSLLCVQSVKAGYSSFMYRGYELSVYGSSEITSISLYSLCCLCRVRVCIRIRRQRESNYLKKERANEHKHNERIRKTNVFISFTPKKRNYFFLKLTKKHLQNINRCVKKEKKSPNFKYLQLLK